MSEHKTAAYDPATLYAQWTNAAKDIRRRFASASVGAFWDAEARARAWLDGAVQIHVVEDIAAYLIEQIARDDAKASAVETYADMLNDVRASRAEVSELRRTLTALETEVAELRSQLDQ